MLDGCDFTGATLFQSTLTRARARKADFERARFSGCNAECADFTGALLEHVTLKAGTFRGATFTGARIIPNDVRDVVGLPMPQLDLSALYDFPWIDGVWSLVPNGHARDSNTIGLVVPATDDLTQGFYWVTERARIGPIPAWVLYRAHRITTP